MKEVLRILERDPRTPVAQIAIMTGLSEGDVRQSIVDCEREGIIRRYKTAIDWEKAGEERVAAFIDVQVTPEREVGFDDVAARIYRYPEVLSVYLVSGSHDLRVVVQGGSMHEVASFVAEKLAPIDHIRSTATYFVLKKYKEDGDVLVEAEEDRRLAVTP